MKKNLLLFVISICTILTINGQSNKGYVKYKIAVSSDVPEMEMAIQMFSDSKLEVYFNESNSLTDMKLGSMMSLKTIISESEGVLLLVDGMMGNLAIRTTKSEMDELNDETADLEVQFSSETKDILNYKCKRAEVIQGENSLIFWYSESLMMPENDLLNAGGKIPGLILAFETDDGGMQMSFEATEVKESFEESDVFSIAIPEGFKEVTFKEFTTMGGL